MWYFKKFYSLSSQEIDKINIFDVHKIPKLIDVLDVFPDTNFQIDFKTDEVVQPALDAIKKSKAFERVCVASFNSKRLKGVRKNYPDICISMGPKEVYKTLAASFNLYKNNIPGDCLQIPMSYYGIKVVTKRFVNFLKLNGLKVMVWTINDVETFKFLIDLNVDGIITDRPKLLFEILKKSKDTF